MGMFSNVWHAVPQDVADAPYIRDFAITDSHVWVLTKNSVIFRSRAEHQWRQITGVRPGQSLMDVADIGVVGNSDVMLLSPGAWGDVYHSDGTYVGVDGRGVVDYTTYDQQIGCTSGGTVLLFLQLWVWKLENGHWEEAGFANYGYPRDVQADDNNVLWWTDGKFIHQYDGDTGDNRHTPVSYFDAETDYSIEHFAVAADGNATWCLVTTDSSGFLLHRSSSSAWIPLVTPEFLTSETITDLVVDRQNTLWVATCDNGIYRLKDTAWEQFTVGNGLGTNDVEILGIGSDDTIYAGLADSTIAVFDRNAWVTETIEITTGVAEAVAQPTGLAILGTYPNPFNPETTIRYLLPRDGAVSISIYSITGQRVTTLVETFQHAGEQAVNWRVDHCASGEYIVMIDMNGNRQTRKVMHLK